MSRTTVWIDTLVIRSTKGTSTCRPGSRTASRRRPRRRPTPRWYCWTRRRLDPARIATTISTTRMGRTTSTGEATPRRDRDKGITGVRGNTVREIDATPGHLAAGADAPAGRVSRDRSLLRSVSRVAEHATQVHDLLGVDVLVAGLLQSL